MGGWKKWQMEQDAARRSFDAADLEEFATLLCGEVDGEFIRCASPGRPETDRSCWVKVDGRGQPYIYESQGRLGAAYTYVRERLGIGQRPRGTDYSSVAMRLLGETGAATGTAVERYLRKRGLTLPIPPCLRYHPALWHRETSCKWPAMVAERTNVEGRVVAVHRTFLAHTAAAKAPIDPVRMDLGKVRGTAIRLSPVAEELLVGEGIETTLSAIQITGRPGWAAGSAAMMRELELPASVKTVIILADGDDPGEQAAISSARRWLREGRRVKIVRAPRGSDFNDVLRSNSR